jgi:drug/metabolite transporter (DMT)-like permease
MADFAIVLVTLVWGTTFLIVQDALQDVAPGVFLFLRFLIAGGAMLVVAWLSARRRPRTPGVHDLRDVALWRDAFAVGTALFLGYFTQTLGLLWTQTSTSAFLTSLAMVFVPVLGFVFARERPGAWTWTGVAVAAAGLAALTLRGRLGFGPGEAITLGTALAFGAHIRLTATFAPRSFPVDLTAAQLLVAAAWSIGALALDPVLVARGASPPVPASWALQLTPRVWVALLVCGLLGSSVAFAVQSWAQRMLPATRVGLLFTLEPVFAAIVAAVWGGERFGARGVAGMLLILAGIVIVETLGRETKKT